MQSLCRIDPSPSTTLPMLCITCQWYFAVRALHPASTAVAEHDLC